MTSVHLLHLLSWVESVPQRLLVSLCSTYPIHNCQPVLQTQSLIKSFTFLRVLGYYLASEDTDAGSVSSKLSFLRPWTCWAASPGQLPLQSGYMHWGYTAAARFRAQSFSSLGLCSHLCPLSPIQIWVLFGGLCT